MRERLPPILASIAQGLGLIPRRFSTKEEAETAVIVDFLEDGIPGNNSVVLVIPEGGERDHSPPEKKSISNKD